MILQEFITYPKNNILSEYNESSNIIVTNIQLITKQLRVTITLKKNICNSLSIVIALNLFYKNFTLTIVILNQEEKEIMDEI